MANTVFSNKVIEAKAKDLLATRVNMRSLMSVDNTLAENEGMTKTINVYTYTGKVEKLADGAKNSVRGAIDFVGTDYTVQRAQQVFDYTDADFMKDSSIVDIMLKEANNLMVNDMTADFIAECHKATLEHTAAIGYEAIVDAIQKLNIEDESKLFVVIPTAWKADLRKDEDYKNARMGEVIYNGQVGTICGIPVVATNALDDEAYVMSAEAVKLFMKEDVEVEQDRDIETKTNTIVLSAYFICALVDNTKICKLKKSA
jgi:HK97 family phage major capsid protein